MSLHIVDYIILIVSLCSSFSIGLYFACAKDKNKTPDDYLVAGRSMNLIPVTISFIVSFFSAISMLGNASEIYYYGIEVWFAVFGWCASLSLNAAIMVPLFHPLKLTSVHHYLLLRYKSKALMYTGTCIQTVTFCFINGVVLFGPAIMLNSYSGVPVWISILATGIISTIYTSIGGFKAVIWSDVFQAVIIAVGLITINVLGTIQVGGIGEIWNIYSAHGRAMPNFSPSIFVRSSVPGFVLGFSVTGFCFFSVMQVSVQRICSLPTKKAAQMSLLLSAIPYTIVVSLTCTSGIVAFAYFANLGCDPLYSGQISNPNQIIPYYVGLVLNYPGVPGLFIASIFCGSLSNLSSFYNSVSAMVWDDIIKDRIETQKISEFRKTLITKIIAFIAGILSTLCGFIVSQLGGTLIQIAMIIGSSSLSPIAVVIYLGALTPRASVKSSCIGALFTISLILWLNLGSNLKSVHKHTLPPVTTNCTHMGPNSTAWLNATYIRHNDTFYYDNGHMQGGEITNTQWNNASQNSEDDDVFIMYKISFVWFTPMGILLGLTIGFILSYIPGLSNKDPVDPKYLFPFIRYLLRKTGYIGLEKEQNGFYIAAENQNSTRI